MAPMERHFARNFKEGPFLVLTAGYKLPGRVRQRATSLSAVQAFAFVVFRILSVTCSLTRALSQSLAHAQQLRAEGLHFSAFHTYMYLQAH